MRRWLIGLLTAAAAHGSTVELFNERGEPSASLLVKKGITAGVLLDEEGAFFCNAFIVRRQNQFQLATASHCVRDRWAQTPRPRTEFAYQDDRGVTRTIAVDAPATYLGEVETEEHSEGTNPLDFALIPIGPNPDWKTLEWERKKSAQTSAYVVYYHRANGQPDSSLYLHAIACTVAPKIPAVRVSVTATDGNLQRLDYFTAVTAKGQAHDEAVDLFLDHCKIPLPTGASGALVVDAHWQPIALLHTGVTTHQFSIGWQKGGWRDEAKIQPGDTLAGHFLASDGKAYGPLPADSLFEGRGNPIFLFGAALRLDVAAQHTAD